ncbi:MAG: sulfite exporter TauE/SafE family protein [Candidatus Binatia bacterium]
MIGVAESLLLASGAFVAATLAAVAGFGGAAVLLPLLTLVFGVREAIPALTVAQLIGNASRVWFNRRELNFPVVGWFALGGVPAALVGGMLFASVPPLALKRLLGSFLVLIVIYRHTRRAQIPRFPMRGFAVIGAVLSFFSALLGSVGPLMAPFFLAYGLIKGAYIGTEALATVIMHVTKLVVYQSASVLTPKGLIVGLALGPMMVLGSFVGKRVLDRLPEKVFVMIIEATLIIAGLGFLIYA